jgi:pimeloyl-ACP methyl ester carboxylesterase
MTKQTISNSVTGQTLLSRRQSLALAASGVAVLVTPAFASAQKEMSMSTAVKIADPTGIRPMQIEFPLPAVEEMRRRIKATIWPERETVPDASQGVQLATIQAVASYWAGDYDWRRCEAQLNAHPNFLTEIDGLDIHFIHVRSKHANALPIIITHGWPGSIIEQMKLIDPLTNPTAHGGTEADAFHVVIPSLPGFGLSERPSTTGWSPPAIARAWTELMRRLGYDRFVAQGGDWGSAVAEQMALQAPPELLGIHVNLAAAVPGDILNMARQGQPTPAKFSAEEAAAYESVVDFLHKGLGYALEMANRPQTLYGIADSPIGLAAWFLDHDIRSYKLIARVFDGAEEGLTRDDVLDNITLCWLTNTAISSARIYWENRVPFFLPQNITLPTAVSVFPDEIYAAPRSWTERAYPNLIHFNRLPRGGHFAAWEQPALFTSELRTAFRTLRRQA